MKKLLIFALIGVAVVVAIGVPVAWWLVSAVQTQKAEGEAFAEQVLRDLSEEWRSASVERYASEELKASDLLADHAEALQGLAHHGRLQEARWEGFYINQRSGSAGEGLYLSLHGVARFEQGEQPVVMHLVKRDDAWLLNGFQIGGAAPDSGG